MGTALCVPQGRVAAQVVGCRGRAFGGFLRDVLGRRQRREKGEVWVIWGGMSVGNREVKEIQRSGGM